MTDQVTFGRRGPAAVVRVVGDLDLVSAPAIGKDIEQHRDRSRPLLLDLTAVSFLDSAGVRLLDALVGELDEAGTAIRLVVGERGVARMTLQLCAFREDLLAADLDRAADEVTG